MRHHNKIILAERRKKFQWHKMKRAGKKHLQLFSSPPPLSLSPCILLVVPFFGDPLGGGGLKPPHAAPPPPPLGAPLVNDTLTLPQFVKNDKHFSTSLTYLLLILLLYRRWPTFIKKILLANSKLTCTINLSPRTYLYTLRHHWTNKRSRNVPTHVSWLKEGSWNLKGLSLT